MNATSDTETLKDDGTSLKDKEEPDSDPWAIPQLVSQGKSWRHLDRNEKCKRVLWSWICRPLLLLGCLYMFICSLSLLGSAFQLLGGKLAGDAFQNNQIISNPIAGVMLGILATVLVQSSSTTTSIIVAMVSSGILNVKQAIPIIMGVNIGTSVTNTFVSFGNAKNRDEFRRAFAGATIHDMFNFLSLITLLPIELASSYLYRLTRAIVDSYHLEGDGGGNVDLLSTITKPFTERIVILNLTRLEQIASGNSTVSGSLIVDRCGDSRCEFLFYDVDLSDSVVGAVVLVIALIMLCGCLILIVKLLQSMLYGHLAFVIRKAVNADFPKPFGFLTGYVAIVIGAGITMLVQSSSVFTSTLTPLVGVGVVTIERMFPLTLGANIGTTITGILAALASKGDFRHALQIALCHLFFNISGILLWYPIPKLRKVPICCAQWLGNTTARYRWFPIFYVILVFFFIPGILFGLSLAGWYVLVAVAGPVVVIAVFIILVNTLQDKKPHWLSTRLQSWDWLPLWMHSWDPLDHLLVRCGAKLKSFCNCTVCKRMKHSASPYDILPEDGQDEALSGARNQTYTTKL